MKLDYLYLQIYLILQQLFMEWTIKKHSMIITASNYYINIIYIKLNKIVKDHEVGTLLFDPTTENVNDAFDS